MPRPVIQQLMCLSSGTIANLTNLTSYKDIEQFQGALVGQARIWLESGVIQSNMSWMEVWDLFKHFFETFRDLEEAENESNNDPASSTKLSVPAPAC